MATPTLVQPAPNRWISPVTVAAAAILLGHILVLVLMKAGPAKVMGSNLAQLASSVLAFAACVMAARKTRTWARSFWELIATSYFLWSVAQIFWTYKERVYGLGSAQFSWVDILFFYALTPFALTLLLNASTSEKKVDWQRTFDLVQVAIVIFCAYVYVFNVPTKWETEQLNMQSMVSIVFQSRNLLIGVALVLKYFLSGTRRERSLFGTAAFLMATYSLATRVANSALVYFHIETGTWFDLGWTAPFLLAAIVAWRWQDTDESTLPKVRQSGIRRQLALHFAPTLIPALVLFMGANIASEQLEIASIAILASFTIYSLRLWVTQYDQQKAVEQLRETEERFRLLFAHNPQPTWVYDRETLYFLEVNDAAVRKYGYSREEFLQMKVTEVRPAEDVVGFLEDLKLSGPHVGEWRHQLKDGTIIHVFVMAEPIEFGGRLCELVIVQDISERKQLEEQLRQAQKMEALGTLAGGIAHDFNNVLTVISGYSQLVLERSGHDEQLTTEIQQIEVAANRAAGLIRQLLAFSRRQVIQPKVVSLEEIVLGVKSMLLRLIGEHIELVVRSVPDLALIKADPGQMEQVLINLAVNGRDAIEAKSERGGRLIFSIHNVELHDEFLREHVGAKEGAYVMLTVSDTGCGMDESTQARIFEPFFTTKKGSGTGLGLSTVYGIVQQTGGYITVDSVSGTGSTFKIYLPQATPASKKESTHEESSHKLRAGCETILLVEDDEGLRELTLKVLSRQGYKVIAANGSSQAEQLCKEHAGEIDIVLTDVVMPGLGGRELVSRLLELQPNLEVLFMSGYTDQVVLKEGVAEGKTNFIQKPFTPTSLGKKVREVLDGAAKVN